MGDAGCGPADLDAADNTDDVVVDDESPDRAVKVRRRIRLVSARMVLMGLAGAEPVS